MGITVWYQLRRDAPLDGDERDHLVETLSGWAWETEFELGEAGALARGSVELDDRDGADVDRFLEALSALAVAIADAECVVEDSADRVSWDAGRGAFVFKRPRRRKPAEVATPPPAPRPVAPVKLPAPRFAAEGLDAWRAVVPLALPLPPGPASGWTSAFNLFGPRPVLARGDRGYDRGLDSDMLRILLAETGRPVDPTEQEGLLLATPIPATTSATVLLTRLLRDGRYHVRQKAALCLGLLGDPACVPALVERLDDDDNDARRGAAEALGLIGDASAAIELARRPWDSDSSVSIARLEAIDRLDAWALAAPLLDRSSGEDAAALAAAILDAIDEDECGELAEFLSHSDRDFQRAAARVISHRPSLAVSAVEALIVRLRDSGDEHVGVLCAEACGASGEEALEPLLELLEDDGWEPRAFACIALGSNPELASMATDELRARLEDGDDDVRREAALALLVGGGNDLRAEEIVSGLATPRYGWLERAARRSTSLPALSTAGVLLGYVPPSVELLPLLADTRVDASVRGVAAMLLALAEPDLVWNLLDRLARDDARQTPMDLRRYAAGALLLTGRAPVLLPTVHRILLAHAGEVQTRGLGRVDELRDAVGELATLATKDGDWPVRLDALRLLQSLGPDAAVPYRSLIAYTARHDPDADVRYQASVLLAPKWHEPSVADRLADTLIAQHGAADDAERVQAFRTLADAEPRLARQLARHFFRSDDRNLARTGAEILGRTADPAEVGQLVGLGVARLEDSNWIVREAACDLLGYIPVGVLPDGMLDEIAEALKVRTDEDADNDVRTAATTALARLGRPVPADDDDEDDD